MTEIELKFQVPAARRAAVTRAVATRSAQRVQLRAQYYDSADRCLAQAQMALRVRKEGRRWVQTLKGAGDGMWQRLEHEVVLAVPAGTVPAADPALHDGTPAGDALRRVLGEAQLVPTYGTEVRRTRRLLRAPGCQVELAFDEGALTAGDRRWPLCELEFELKGGDAAALVALAARWVQRFGLTLDVRTKAERGARLARGVRLGEPVKARAPMLPENVGGADALRAMVSACLVQVLGNASEIAHEAQTTPEHLHQLRVGLRRLRTVLRELGELSPQTDPSWLDALSQLFARFGAARDRDALEQTLLPALRKAGVPDLELPPMADDADAQQALCEVATTRLWLTLLAFAAGTEAGDAPAEPRVRQHLARLYRQVGRGATRFESLDDSLRHRLRRRVKRLRYLSELAAPLYPRKAARAFLKRMGPAQETLGVFNDLCVARSLFAAPAREDGQAMFALGWLARERDIAIQRCMLALADLRRAKGFWRTRRSK